jgi:hypothetical protein
VCTAYLSCPADWTSTGYNTFQHLSVAAVVKDEISNVFMIHLKWQGSFRTSNTDISNIVCQPNFSNHMF